MTGQGTAIAKRGMITRRKREVKMTGKRLLFTVLLIATECIASTGFPASASAQSDENVRCGCLIVGLQGKAKVTPPNSWKAVAAAPNMPVFSGDTVDVAESSRVSLICGEAHTSHEWTVGINP